MNKIDALYEFLKEDNKIVLCWSHYSYANNQKEIMFDYYEGLWKCKKLPKDLVFVGYL